MNDRLEKEARIPGDTSAGTIDYHKFAKDILWIAFSQVFISIVMGIILLPVITKNYSTDVYAIWIQVNLWVDLLVPFLSLQLGLAAVRYLAGEDDAQKRRRYLGAMLSAIIIFGLFVSTISIPFASTLSNLLFGTSSYINYIFLLFTWTLINTVYNFFLSYLQARGKNRHISIIQITITILKVITISVLAFTGASMVMVIVSQIVLNVAFIMYLVLVVTLENGVPVPGFSGLKTFLAYSVPFIPGIIFLWIIRSSDRNFIIHFIGLSESGIYSVSQQVGSLASLFYYPISFVLFSLVSKLWVQKRIDDIKRYFEYSQRLFLTIAIPGVVGIAYLSQSLLGALTPSGYLAGKDLVFLVALGFIFFGIYQMNINLILLDKRSKLLPLVMAAGALTSVFFNFMLIPHFGLIGAAFASCAAYLVLGLISTVWARKMVPYKIDVLFYLKVILATLVMRLSINLLKLTSDWVAILAILVGFIAYGVSLLLLRAFSGKDKEVIKNILSGLIPNKRIK